MSQNNIELIIFLLVFIFLITQLFNISLVTKYRKYLISLILLLIIGCLFILFGIQLVVSLLAVLITIATLIFVFMLPNKVLYILILATLLFMLFCTLLGIDQVVSTFGAILFLLFGCFLFKRLVYEKIFN